MWAVQAIRAQGLGVAFVSPVVFVDGPSRWVDQAPKHCERLFYRKIRDAVHSFQLRSDIKHVAEARSVLGLFGLSLVCVLFSVRPSPRGTVCVWGN